MDAFYQNEPFLRHPYSLVDIYHPRRSPSPTGHPFSFAYGCDDTQVGAEAESSPSTLPNHLTEMSPTSSQPRSESSYLHFDDTPRQTEFFPSSSTLLHIAGSTTLPVVTDAKVAHSPTVVDLVTFPADRSVPGHSKLLTVPVQSQSSRGPAYVHRAHSRASSDPTSLSSVLKSHEPLYGIPYGYHAYAYDYRSRSPYGRLGATQPYSIWSMDALPMSQMQQHRDSWSAYSGRAFSDPSLHSTGARSPLVVPLSLRNVGIVSHGAARGSPARTEKGFRERKIRLIKARTQAVRGRSQQRRKLTLPHWSLGARLERALRSIRRFLTSGFASSSSRKGQDIFW